MNRRDFLAAAAAAPFALAAAPAALGSQARLRKPLPLALVTADLESHVVAYDIATGRVVRHIETPAGPKSIELVGEGTAALVAHTAEGAISLIDVATLRVRAVLRGFVEPRYTAAGADGRHAYVTDAGRGEVVTIDVHRGRVVHRTTVGPKARHITLDPHSGQLWTALGFSAPEIVVVDVSEPARPRVTATVVPSFPAHDVVFAPGGERIWVSSGSEQLLAVFARSGRRPLFTLAAGKPPQHITFTSSAAYVTSDDAVRIHALDDGRLIRETAVAEGSYNVTQGWGRVLTPSLERGTLSVLDTRGRLLTRPTLARAAHDVCYTLKA
jgi:DNA-binding beta-propeller fold protein YncE